MLSAPKGRVTPLKILYLNGEFLMRFQAFPSILALAAMPAAGATGPALDQQFEQNVTISFRVNNDGYAFTFNFCSKDTESKDGINLPGHHGCGTKKRVLASAYLG